MQVHRLCDKPSVNLHWTWYNICPESSNWSNCLYLQGVEKGSAEAAYFEGGLGVSRGSNIWGGVCGGTVGTKNQIGKVFLH